MLWVKLTDETYAQYMKHANRHARRAMATMVRRASSNARTALRLTSEEALNRSLKCRAKAEVLLNDVLRQAVGA